MITVISGTNRPNSFTSIVSRQYVELLKEVTEEPVHLIDLAELPHDWFTPVMYQENQQGAIIRKLQDEYIAPASRLVVISPEYNSSFPGVLKLFIDALSVRDYKKTFSGKFIALVGVATGRAGNIRGMEELTSIFNYMGSVVYPSKLPLTSLKGSISDGAIHDVAVLETLRKHATSFSQWLVMQHL